MKIYTLENDFIRAEFLSLGATILSLTIKPLARNVVLTNADLAIYQKRDASYYGATVGPVAGRIKNARYKINDKEVELAANERGKHTLHGGAWGFSFQEFRVELFSSTKIIFAYHHHENIDRFNGEYDVKVIYTLEKSGLSIEYIVDPKEDVLLNITNHSYFNLAGEGDILAHEIRAQTIGYYAFDAELINTNLVPLESGDVLNLSKVKKLGEIIFDPSIYNAPSMGIDHLYLLSEGRVYLKTKDLSLEVVTNYSAVQLYTTNYPSPYPLKEHGAVNIHRAIAIEPVDPVCGKDDEYKEIQRAANQEYKRKITYLFTIL